MILQIFKKSRKFFDELKQENGIFPIILIQIY